MKRVADIREPTTGRGRHQASIDESRSWQVGLTRLAVALFVLSILSWLALELVAPQILRDAYEGRSIPGLNALISGQRDHPVSEYLDALSAFKRELVFSMVGLASLLGLIRVVERYPSYRRQVTVLVFTLVSAALLTPIYFSLPIDIFDEGFVASGAMSIRDGLLPIRDFYVIYGPGQYYLTAAAFSVFGEDLTASRALHVVTMVMLGLALVACTATLVPRSRGWQFWAALCYLLAAANIVPNSGYAAIPAVLLLAVAGLSFAGWSATGEGTRLLCASVLVGLSGLFRWDFGIFGLAALTLAVGAVTIAQGRKGAAVAAALSLAIAPGIAVGLSGFAPLLILGDAGRWFDEVPRFLLLEFKTWRNVEFIGPTLASLARHWSSGNYFALITLASHLAYAALVPCTVIAALAIALPRLRRNPSKIQPADALALVMGLMALLLLNQMRVRSGFPQGFPALVLALPLLAYVLVAVPSKTRIQRQALSGLSLVLAGILIVAPWFVAQRAFASAMTTAVRQEATLVRAAHLRAPTKPRARDQWDNYANLINHVRVATQAGEPIFSGVADTSRLVINDAALYFLTDRPAATRWVEMEPGLTNTEWGQHELIDALESRKVRTLVLWTRTANEPNATARSNGVHLFDDYVRQTFEVSQKFGNYDVWVRRRQ